jgi:hypothetical protein
MSAVLASTPDPERDPSKPGPKLTEADRRAVIAHYMTSGSIQLTANEFKLHRNTVADLVKTVREASNSPLSTDWRSNMRPKAIAAVNNGLDCSEDAYKQANVGVQVLKGLGDFRGDSEVSIVTMISNAPAGVDAITTALSQDAIDLESTPVLDSSSPNPPTISSGTE